MQRVHQHCDKSTSTPVGVDRQRREEAQVLGDRIAVLAAQIHAATYRMLVLLREFDEKRGWDGWKSCAQWLSWRTGIGLDAAREKVRVAAALPGLPRVSAAFQRGELSYSKARALTRVATPATEEVLLGLAVRGTASELEAIVRGFRRADPERENEQANRDHERRYLSTRHDERGNLVIEGRLPAELGARFLKALDAACDAVRRETRAAETKGDGAASPRKGERDEVRPASASSSGQMRADALVFLADGALAGGLSGRRAADTHQVVVHVDAEVLADPAAEGRSQLENGPGIAAETSRRLACDAAVVTIREGEAGEPLSVGRRRRTVPPAIRRALAARDSGCRFPGCHHTRFLEAHHIEHWAAGGETKLENLLHLCSFHHRLLHEGGFRVRSERDGELVFTNRFGVAVAAPRQRGSVEELQEEVGELAIMASALPKP